MRHAGLSRCVRCGAIAAAALAFVIAAGITAFASSARLQGLLLFVWVLDWPPADWDAPMLPFPCWSKAACRWDEVESAWIPPGGSFRPGDLRTWVADPLSFFSFRGVRVLNATAIRVPTARPGVTLGAWVMHGASGRGRVHSGSGFTLLYAHGNAGNRATEHRVRLYENLLNNVDCDIDTVIAFDYSGFADSGGGDERAWDLAEDRVVDDMLAVDAWVRQSSLNPTRLVWWGHSLGTGVALGALERLAKSDLGGTGKSAALLPDGLVLEAPFTSAVEVAAIDWGSLARTHLVHTFHSLQRAELRLVQTLVLHGERDMVIPFAHGQAISRAAGATFEAFDSCHTDIVVRRLQLAHAVNAFVARLLEVPGTSKSSQVAV